MIKVRDITEAVERIAPLRYKEDYDNPGLQVGFFDSPVSKVLVCLDVTEAVIDEAISLGCQMIVSHHPLLYRPVGQVSDLDFVQRCIVKAVKNDINIYSAHTNLDNARGGVNWTIGGRIGLQDIEWLSPKDGTCGSGAIGTLAEPMSDEAFALKVKEAFKVECLQHNAFCGREIRRVAVCGGSGSSLLREAVAAGADCYLTGEFHYHDWFGREDILMLHLGHYQSEQYTKDLLAGIMAEALPELEIVLTSLNTNPTFYL